jgi:hypothetical protein
MALGFATHARIRGLGAPGRDGSVWPRAEEQENAMEKRAAAAKGR